MTTSNALESAAPATVFGVPLEPGERVVSFLRVEPGWQRWVEIVVGFLLAWTFIGLIFFFGGLMSKTTCYVVTTRRFLQITRKKTEQIRVETILAQSAASLRPNPV